MKVASALLASKTLLAAASATTLRLFSALLTRNLVKSADSKRKLLQLVRLREPPLLPRLRKRRLLLHKLPLRQILQPMQTKRRRRRVRLKKLRLAEPLLKMEHLMVKPQLQTVRASAVVVVVDEVTAEVAEATIADNAVTEVATVATTAATVRTKTDSSPRQERSPSLAEETIEATAVETAAIVAEIVVETLTTEEEIEGVAEEVDPRLQLREEKEVSNNLLLRRTKK